MERMHNVLNPLTDKHLRTTPLSFGPAWTSTAGRCAEFCDEMIPAFFGIMRKRSMVLAFFIAYRPIQ